MEMGRISDGPPSAGGRSLSSAKLQESCANLHFVHSRSGGLAPPLSALGMYGFPLDFQCSMRRCAARPAALCPPPLGPRLRAPECWLFGEVGVGAARRFLKRHCLRTTSRPPTLLFPTGGGNDRRCRSISP